MAEKDKEEFDLEAAIGRHEEHAKGLLDLHGKTYGGYYAKKGEEPQDISDTVKGKFGAMMGYIGGNFEQLDLNYKWADRNVKAGDISDEYGLFEFTKKFAGAIGHELGNYDISTQDGKDAMRSRIQNLLRAAGYSSADAESKIRDLIESKGEVKDVIDIIKSVMKTQHRGELLTRAFDKYDMDLSADQALEFSAAIRAYEHEMSQRTVRKDYKELAVSREKRSEALGEMYAVLQHPDHSLYGKAKEGQQAALLGAKIQKYKPK